MSIRAGGKRPFPAVVIVLLLLLICLFGQLWVAPLLPQVAGMVRATPGLVVLDIPVRLPFTIDLIIAASLFLIGYLIAIIIYSARLPKSGIREFSFRLIALFTGTFLLLFCVAVGGLLTWLIQDHLPRNIHNAIESLGINADLVLPSTGPSPLHIHGNIIVLLALVIGAILFFGKLGKPIAKKKKTLQLTREQRMTPYQRMLEERRSQQKNAPNTQQKTIQKASGPVCNNQPLYTLRPEAVNYRPI